MRSVLHDGREFGQHPPLRQHLSEPGILIKLQSVMAALVLKLLPAHKCIEDCCCHCWLIKCVVESCEQRVCVCNPVCWILLVCSSRGCCVLLRRLDKEIVPFWTLVWCCITTPRKNDFYLTWLKGTNTTQFNLIWLFSRCNESFPYPFVNIFGCIYLTGKLISSS